jgi:hypothetical protein
MPEQEFHFEVTNQLVYVRMDVSSHAGRTRFYALAFYAGVMVPLMYALLFAPGKHGNPSMWHDLSTFSVSSSGFIVPLFLLVSVPLLMGILLSPVG